MLHLCLLVLNLRARKDFLIMVNLTKSIMLSVVLASVLGAAYATRSALECINACWSVIQNPRHLATVLDCMEDPPLEDTMCIVACDSRDRNFAFKDICKSCREEPPVLESLCAVACDMDNLDNFGKICGFCEKNMKYQ